MDSEMDVNQRNRQYLLVTCICRHTTTRKIFRVWRVFTSTSFFTADFREVHRVLSMYVHDIITDITSPTCSFCIRFPKLCRICFYIFCLDVSDKYRWLRLHFPWAPQFTSTTSSPLKDTMNTWFTYIVSVIFIHPCMSVIFIYPCILRRMFTNAGHSYEWPHIEWKHSRAPCW